MQQILFVYILQREADLNQPAQNLFFIQVRSSIGLLLQSLVQVSRLTVVRDNTHVGTMLKGVLATVGEVEKAKRLVECLVVVIGKV